MAKMHSHVIMIGEDLNIIAPHIVGVKLLQGQQMIVLERNPAAPLPDGYVGMEVKVKLTGFALDDQQAGFRVKLPAGLNGLKVQPGTACVCTSCTGARTIQDHNEQLSKLEFDSITVDETYGYIRTLYDDDEE